jgi:thiosulfate reductase cytochrome b subunit
MKRHTLSTRIWHWVNAAALLVLFMSGLTISNAHRYLYWGNYGFDPADAWLTVMRFPGWMTLPTRYNLAAARDWHITAAWVFALGLLAIWVAMLLSGHFRRNIALWKAADHQPYKPLQKLAYGGVYGVLLPLMVCTGLAISPGFEPAAPWLVDLLGGRQSARSLHFITTWLLVGFVIGHVLMTLLSGPVQLVGAMIHGGKQEETPDA